jgi:acylglycerol lipase
VLEAQLERVRVPFLALHGTADSVVDVSSSRRLLAASPSPDKTLIELPGALHSLLCEFPPVRTAVLGHIIEWLEPRAAAAAAAAAGGEEVAPHGASVGC